MNDDTLTFLVRHLGAHVAPGKTDPVDILGTGHPIFGTRGVNLSGQVQRRGIKDHSNAFFLVRDGQVTCDAYLGVFYTPESSTASLRVHEVLPQLLQEFGVGQDFPIKVRVWRGNNDLETEIPADVLSVYRSFPIEFMPANAGRPVRFAGGFMSRAMLADLRQAAQSGEEYLSFRSARSPSALVPMLELFRDAVGVSTAEGVILSTPRRLDLLDRLAAEGARPLFIVQALRRMSRGTRLKKPDFPDGILSGEYEWLGERLVQGGLWTGADQTTLENRHPSLADAVFRVSDIAMTESLMDSDIEQARQMAS